MPNFIDPLRMKSGSTEVTIVSTGRVLQNITIGSGTIASLETATSDTTLANYGISILPYTTDGATVSLAAPVAGMRKTLILYSTVAIPESTEVYTYVDCSSDVQILYDSTQLVTQNKIKFAPPYTFVELIGISTDKWAVASFMGATGSTVSFSS